MPILSIMKSFFYVGLFFYVSGLFAAPLEAGFSLAPKASAPAEEKAQAYLEARYLVLSAAVKYEKTPYRYGGLNKNGLDCSGFIYLSFKDALGVSLPRSAAALQSWVEEIPSDKPQPGDLLFFKMDSTTKTSHVALYLGNGYFIHSASAGPKTGVIISNFNDKYWARNYVGAGRAFPQADESGVKMILTSLPLLLMLTDDAVNDAKTDDSIGLIQKD